MKTDRIDIRVNAKTKNELTRQARKKGLTLTSYLLTRKK